MIWRRRPTSSARRHRSGSGRGRTGGLTRQAEESDRLSVERIGLGETTHGSREVTDLAWVHHAERQPGAGEGCRNGGLEAACRFEDDKGDRPSTEAANQVVETFRVPLDPKALACWSEVDVETLFGHVDADEEGR